MWPNPQFPTDLVTFTEEILNGKLHFLRSDYLHLKLRSVSFLSISRLLIQLSLEAVRWGSQEYFFGNFQLVVTKSSVTEILFSKFDAFSIFSWTLLDGCVWSMKVNLWGASYSRHSNNIQSSKSLLQRLLMEIRFTWKLQVLFK